ncbi:hypothetical protein Poly41_13860 [Novipirellula artificiosorum]|uniref:Sel1 repeat protein n=2 Tax=Novipirellula artificiosorum TaxID=2528016 RepID=A0A5C6DTB5_9BACT|nr:hypothetical protein Poly41_13860 [Novipirellula artificiosorum]
MKPSSLYNRSATVDSKSGRFMLSEGQLAALRRKAEDGDADAAYRIGMFIAWFPKTAMNNYDFDKSDETYWLRKAADQGHVDALQYLAILTHEEGTWETSAVQEISNPDDPTP